MNAKGILFYNYNNARIGFSEVYYLNGVSIGDCAALLDSLNTDRMAVLCNNVTCAGGMVSDVAIKGDSLLIPPTTKVGTFTGGTGDVSVADDIGLLVRLEATSAHRGLRILHGVPATAYKDGLLDLDPAHGYLTAVNAFLTTVLTDCRLRVKHPGVPPTYTYDALTAAVIRRPAFRNLGRPFGLLHGHRMIA